MPYGNFDDNFATRLVYDRQQEQDPDLTLGEFIFGKLLYVGDLIDKDDDALPPKAPLKDSPFQILQIQAGSIEISKPEVKLQDITTTDAKPSCLFRENKFGREFPIPVFHPPAA